MNADRWPLVKEHFADVLDLPPERREAYLSALDDDTRADVEALLDADTEHGVLDTPLDTDLFLHGIDKLGVDRASTEAEESARADRLVGAHVGPYLVEARIGRGGMGDVYRARRADGLFDRAVALKVVRTDSEALLARFAAERRILGALEHPGIARLIAAGAEPDGPTAGRPWLALELVDGVPLTEAVASLSLDERLRLLAEVAETAHHAHRRLVVHRDLKPSNVLVAEDPGSSPGQARTLRPKLLDFGIAKLLDADDGEALTQTGHHRPMTRAYAAPEQILGQPVTTATDVYGLGLLLFESLTGSRLFQSEAGAHALERAILSTPPPLASSVADVEKGGVEPRLLKGDLDVICRKALAKEPEARYASAAAFADDLRRVLAHQPIEARPPSARYRMRRFVQRHRAAVAGVALLLVAIGVGVASTLWQARQAQAEAARSEATAAFLTSLFQGADPTVTAGDTLTALVLLDRGARRIDAELAGQPATRADLYLVIGDAYYGLGRMDSARVFARRALAVFGPEGPASDTRDALRARILLGRGLAPLGIVRADSVLADAADRARALGDDGLLLDALEGRGLLAAGERLDPRESAAVLEEAVALCRRLEGEDSSRLGRLLYWLSTRVSNSGQHGRAANLLRDALARQPAATDPVARANTLVDLAEVLVYAGQSNEARGYADEAVTLRRRVFGPDDVRTAYALIALANVDVDGVPARPLDGERHAREALRIAEQNRDGASTTEALRSLTEALELQGRSDEAIRIAQRRLDLVAQTYGPESTRHVAATRAFAGLLHRTGNVERSLQVWEDVLPRIESVYGPQSATYVATLAQTGSIAAEAGRTERAETLLTEAYYASRLLPETSQTRAQTAFYYGRFHLDRGALGVALNPLREATERLGEATGIGLFGTIHDGKRAAALLGEALLATGETDEARRLLSTAAAALADAFGTDHPDTVRAREALARAQRTGT